MVAGRRRVTDWAWPASVVILVCTNLFLLWEVRKLRGEVWYEGPGADPRAVMAALDMPLPSVGGPTLVISSNSSRYVLLFFFTPGDCKPCLLQLTELKDVMAHRPDVAVYAIAGYCSLDEARKIDQYYDPGYPILVDQDGALIRLLRVHETPWKVAVDRSRNRIVFNDPASTTFAQRQAFLDRAYHMR